MNTADAESLPIKQQIVTSSAYGNNADVNENNSGKGPHLVTPTITSMSDGAVPFVASPATIVTSMPFSQVSSPPNVMGFATGINLTISNGIINMKNPNGRESTLLVAPATSSLSTPSLSSCAATPSPNTIVKGTVPAVSCPISSAAVTTPTSLFGGTQVTHTHTQLKVPNPTTVQLRPQMYNALQNSNIAVAMQNRLSMPFQTSVAQNLSSPTTISTLRTLSPGSAQAASVLSQQVQFQTMGPIRGTISCGAQSVQQQQAIQAQQMSFRSAAAFPLLFNRPIAFTGRPQLITTQPTRLAPRQIGTQVALQMAGQQPVSGAAIMPFFQPTLPPKAMSVAGASVVSNASITTQAQGQHPQFINQIVSSADMTGLTHVSLRPNTPNVKIVERSQKIADARLFPHPGISSNRPLRLSGPITVTTLSNSCLSSSQIAEAVGSVSNNVAAECTSSNILHSRIDSGLTPEKKLPEYSTSVSGEPQVQLKAASAQSSSASSENPVISSQGPPSHLPPKSPTNKDIVSKKAEGTKTGTTDVSKSEFDALKEMEWSDGIASLPGSSLKFKLNEFGLMEMVTEDSVQAVKTVVVVDSAVGVNTTDFSIATSLTTDSNAQAEMTNKEKERLMKCENCGKYGYLRDFCKAGRFCSQICLSTFTGRKNKQATQSLLSSKMLLNLKKKHKKAAAGEDSQSAVVTPVSEPEVLPEKDKSTVHTPSRKPKGFDWQAYLDEQKAIGAPARLFKDSFPVQKNGFKAGMRLEGVDPKHQNLFCVMSVAEVQGYRLRLHFDGFSECYDVWCNANSPFIFPVGWCEKNNKPLQPPKHVPFENFNWATYLRTTKSIAAPKNLFLSQPATMVTPSAFRVGMKLEAVDRKNTALICVATVADTLGDKVLVHFDGWEDVYDYWCDITSPYIHPVGWCQRNARALSPPCDWPDIEHFTWDDYLNHTKAQAVPARAFKPRPPMGFETGMKVEVVDRRNPILVRVATIQEVREHQVFIHFDGWPEMYDYWLDDDSPDIRPPGWCSRTGHVLQPPYVEESHVQGSCPTPGCSGVGHIKGAKYVGHHSAFGCPYSTLNMNKESTLQDRLGSTRLEEGTAAPLALRVKMESGEIRKCPTPGCDSSGHITGKFTSHHRLSGCPLYEKNVLRMNAELAAKPMIQPGRGRKRKHFCFGESDGRDDNGIRIKRERLDSSISFIDNVHQSVFMSSVPATPSQEGPAFWEYHAKLLPGVGDVRGEEVKGWSVEQVATFVGSLPGCEEHEKIFREQEIDGDSFLLMTQADIVKIMNVKLGPALKIFNSILLFQQTTDS